MFMSLIVGTWSFLRDETFAYGKHWRLAIGLGGCQACRTVAMSYAFIFTYAARVQLLYSVHPLLVGIVCWFLGQALPRRTILALALSLVALFFMFSTDLSTSETRKQNLGDLLAGLTSISVAFFLILSRHAAEHAPKLSVPFASSVGLFLAALGVLALARDDVLTMTPLAFVACFLDGIAVGAINLAFSLAPKFIHPVQVGLTSLIENILGPLWVFAVYREIPPLFTIIGGVLLVVILIAHDLVPLLLGAAEDDIEAPSSSSSSGGERHDDDDEKHILDKEDMVQVIVHDLTAPLLASADDDAK